MTHPEKPRKVTLGLQEVSQLPRVWLAHAGSRRVATGRYPHHRYRCGKHRGQDFLKVRMSLL